MFGLDGRGGREGLLGGAGRPLRRKGPGGGGEKGVHGESVGGPAG